MAISSDGKRVIPESLVPMRDKSSLLRVFEQVGASGFVELSFNTIQLDEARCVVLGMPGQVLSFDSYTLSIEVRRYETVELRFIESV